MILTNREWALLAWIVIFIAFVLYKRDIRRSALPLLRIMIGHPIGTVLLIAVAYAAAFTWVLAKVGIWTPANLKTTVLWGLTFAIVEIFRANKIDEDANYFRRTLRDILSATVFITFVADSYTFRFPIELALVPVIAFFAMMTAVASTNPTHRPVEHLCTGILVLVGLAYLTKGTIETIRNLHEFATLGTARDFVIPILLSILFLPFLYGLNLYMVYEQVFVGLNFGIEDGPLRRFAKRRAILTFRSDLDFLKRWRRLVLSERPPDREGIIRIFDELRSIRSRERHPPIVTADQGWSPYQVAAWLADEGLDAGDYHRSFDDRWTASSKFRKLGDEFLSHTLILHVEGNAIAATQLKLVLYIADADRTDVPPAEKQFRDVAQKLTRLTTGSDLTSKQAVALTANANSKWKIAGVMLNVAKDEWGVGKRRGYERTFVVRHEAHQLEDWEAA